MSKTYTLTARSVNAGMRNNWGSGDWNNFFSANVLSNESMRRPYVGRYGSGSYTYRAVNILFDPTVLATLRTKTITSIKLTVTLVYGTLYANSGNYKIGYKLDAQASTSSAGTAWTRSDANSSAASSTDVAGYLTTANRIESDNDNVQVTVDLTGSTIPKYGYTIGTDQGLNASIILGTSATLTVVTTETDYTLQLAYNANGGSGAPSAQSTTVTTAGSPSATFTIPSTIPTRSGYTFLGWSTSNTATTASYAAGGSITITGNTTLYAVWKAAQSSISSISPASVPIDGSSAVTVNINRTSSAYTHDVKFTLGSRSETLTGQGTSATFVIPTAWLDQLPAATSDTVTVEVTTKNGSTQIGNKVSSSFTVTVPASVKPTVSLSGTDVNDNSTLDSWNVLVAGYSKIKLTASAAAGSGSSISNIAFSGDGVSASGSATTATSSTLTTTGSRTWTVTVTDRRGRTASATLTQTVYAYANPTISAIDAFRALSNGSAAPADGTYIRAKATFACSSIGGKNSVTVRRISYKAHTASSYSTGQSSAANGTYYTFGGGGISILLVYDVKFTVTDAVGNTTEVIVQVQSIAGVAFGLTNDRVRFGGPVQKAGFQCDWEAEFNNTVKVNGENIGNVANLTYTVLTTW